ncbi:MAG: inosine/xanthosine triphosphatase [bacterium]|nr:inosine/xanthosine triphosphatase [bacterium]
MQKVVIASQNPVKITAVKQGFAKMFTDEEFEYVGVSVLSGVSHQPIGDETRTGAFGRVANARKEMPDAHYWVGIEGGLEVLEDDMMAFAWIVIMSRTHTGKARSSSFFIPKKVMELVQQGKELGDANDIVFQRSNSKQDNGAVGILTGDVITRTDYYTETVVLALIPFQNERLY